MMSTKLDRIVEKAKTDGKCRFTSLAHLLTVDFLLETWSQMNRKGAGGVDGVSIEEFEKNLQERCEDIVARLKSGGYQAPPVKRVEIPKGDGKTRPLGIPTVEDRLVQRAVARILESIYETEFLPCSYGFRPGKSTHLALKEVRDKLMAGKVNCVFETDIRGFFNHLSHRWLLRMIRLRVIDPVILRLVGKWLRAGALIDGVVVRTGEGAPQGGPISPLLANICLHYALDLWFEKRVKRGCKGNAHLIRFADDFVVGFQRPLEAKMFAEAVKQRLGKFGLELAEEKTRLMGFGPFSQDRMRPDEEQDVSFDFLGFRHLGKKARDGRFKVVRIPTTKSCRKFLDNTRTWLRIHKHANRRDQQRMLTMKLRGFFQYFGLRDCKPRLELIRLHVVRMWKRTIHQQGQRGKGTWKKFNTLEVFQLPYPKLVHPEV